MSPRVAAVVDVLRSDPVRRINFSYGNCPVFAADYFALANAIERGEVWLAFNSNNTGSFDALYSHTWGDMVVNGRNTKFAANTFYFHPRFNISRILSCGLLIHEATHAIQDAQRLAWNRLDCEASAYVATMMYLLLRGTSPIGEVLRVRRLRGQNSIPSTAALIQTATDIAERILLQRIPNTVTEEEQQRMREVLSDLSPYEGREGQRINFTGY